MMREGCSPKNHVDPKTPRPETMYNLFLSGLCPRRPTHPIKHLTNTDLILVLTTLSLLRPHLISFLPPLVQLSLLTRAFLPFPIPTDHRFLVCLGSHKCFHQDHHQATGVDYCQRLDGKDCEGSRPPAAGWATSESEEMTECQSKAT